MSDNPNGWNEWSKHVLAELKRLNRGYENLRKEFADFKEEIIEKFLKQKAEIVSTKKEVRTLKKITGSAIGIMITIILALGGWLIKLLVK
jgi:mRNA-degrading endonuclease RelE of RelBE toxin-antitoxin system